MPMLLVAQQAGKNEGTPEYPSARVVKATCDAAWPKSIAVLTRAGFAPQSSDKAGGILALVWTRGEMTGATANREARSFTKASRGSLTTFSRLRVDATSVVFAPEGEQCRIQITIGYAVLKSSLAQSGWVAVGSSGLFESKILDGIEADIAKK